MFTDDLNPYKLQVIIKCLDGAPRVRLRFAKSCGDAGLLRQVISD